MCEMSFETVIECMVEKLKQILVPTGTVIIRPTTVVPEGFLECNGAEISREEYSALFEVVGTMYGSGDGAATFNLPDLRGEFVRGWDNERGVDDSRFIGSSQGDAIRNITGRTQYFPNGDLHTTTGVFSRIARGSVPTGIDGGGPWSQGAVEFDASKVVPTANENRPRNIAMMYCIKY